MIPRTAPDRPPRHAALAGMLVVAALVVATGLVAGCGSTSATPTGSAPVTASGPASPSAGAQAGTSSAPSSSIAPTDSPEPSIDSHAIPELEALLPTSIGGIQLERLSIKGPDFYKTGTDVNRSQLDELLKNLGKTVDDLSVADAGDPTGKAVFEIGIFRVDGAKPAQLLSEWVAFDQAAKPGKIQVTTETVAGRALTKIVDSSVPVGGKAWAFTVGDSIFLVRADDPALLTAALTALPKP